MNCNKPISEIEKATDRDNFMRANEAKKFGLIDEVLSSKWFLVMTFEEFKRKFNFKKASNSSDNCT